MYNNLRKVASMQLVDSVLLLERCVLSMHGVTNAMGHFIFPLIFALFLQKLYNQVQTYAQVVDVIQQ